MSTYSFRWGIPLLDEEKPAFIPVYRFMLRSYAKAKITRDEFLCIVHLADYHYESKDGKSKPSLKTIADQMGYAHENSVRNLVKSLKKKEMVIVIENTGYTSEYIFSGFSQKMLELWEQSQTDVPLHSSVVPPSHSDVGVVSHPNVPEEESKNKKTKKNKKEGASATPPAVSTYRQVTSRYPNKALYEDISTAIGDSPEQLEKWAAHIKAWMLRGFNPFNIGGLLDTWAKGGIEPRQPSGQAKRPLASNPADNPNYYEEAAARENEEYIPKGQRQPATASPALHTFVSGKTAPDVWRIACDELSGQLDRDVYHATIGLSQFVEYAEGFVIRVGNQGIKERLEKRLAGRVESALENAAGETVAVRYVVGD